MNVNEAFPSDYLKATDLQGREVSVIINQVQMETIGSDHKPVLYFMGKQKGIVLNKTNSMNIASAYGPETEAWTGKPLILFAAWVDYQGKSVQAIRVRPGTNMAPPQAPQQYQAPQQHAAPSQQAPTHNGGLPHPGIGSPPPGHPADLNDDIPF